MFLGSVILGSSVDVGRARVATTRLLELSRPHCEDEFGLVVALHAHVTFKVEGQNLMQVVETNRFDVGIPKRFQGFQQGAHCHSNLWVLDPIDAKFRT